MARRRVGQIWGPLGEFRAELSQFTTKQLELLRAFHRRSAELNQQRAAEVRELRLE